MLIAAAWPNMGGEAVSRPRILNVRAAGIPNMSKMYTRTCSNKIFYIAHIDHEFSRIKLQIKHIFLWYKNISFWWEMVVIQLVLLSEMCKNCELHAQLLKHVKRVHGMVNHR